MKTKRTAVKGNVEGTAISEQVVFLSIQFERFGNSRRVASEKVEVKADKNRINVTKHLLESDILQAITSLDHEVIQYMQRVCLPYEKGLHVLPLGLVEQVDRQLRDYQRERDNLINKFVGEYPRLLAEAKVPLGDLFNERDYLTPEQARTEFAMRWNYLSLSTPGKLATISPALLQEERDKIQQRMDAAYEEWRSLLRVAVAEMVTRLRDSLVPGADGRVRKLTESSVGRLQEFLETFSFRNVTNDAELEKITNGLKRVMAGLTTDQLRESENVKNSVGAVLAMAASQLNTMTQGIRKFRDED